jgi:pyruvate/2-oxoacid:ferredoxin oxidoreductase alpha subunit
MGFRQRSFEDLEKARLFIRTVDEEYRRHFSRGYGLVEAVDTEGAEVVLVTSGAMTGTARVGIRALRDQGVQAGLLKIKAFRPFPWQEALNGVPKVAVVDRNISIGKEGIFCQELKAALYPLERRPQVFGYIAGLCGDDVSPEMLEQVALRTLRSEGPGPGPVWVRGD